MMWPFKTKRRVKLTNEVFARWLRAHRPPMDLFCGLGETEQEQLAMLGDEYAQDMCVAVGYSVANPQIADANSAHARGGMEGEAKMAEALAKNIAARILMQGQQQVAARATQGRTFFGQEADEDAS